MELGLSRGPTPNEKVLPLCSLNWIGPHYNMEKNKETCFLSFVSIMLSCMFVAALWLPAGKGLTSWLSCVVFSCVFVTFPCAVLGQVWYLIVSITDLCLLPYCYYFSQISQQLHTSRHCRLYHPFNPARQDHTAEHTSRFRPIMNSTRIVPAKNFKRLNCPPA